MLVVRVLCTAMLASIASSNRLIRRLQESVPSGSSSYDLYTANWIANHENWFSVTRESIDCNGVVHFPTCVDGRTLDSDTEPTCPAYICSAEWSSGTCVPTPPDTIDFIPPSPSTSLDITSGFCVPPADHQQPVPPYFGFDTGVPPDFIDLQYPELVLQGQVRAQLGTTCSTVVGATVEMWHVNPSRFDLNSFLGSRSDDSQYGTSQRLRAQSCRGLKTTGDDGSYSFNTSLPPSYGPPRHINIMVTAPGYQPLMTRVYFSDDFRLLQLSIMHGIESTTFIDGVSGQEFLNSFRTSQKLTEEVGNEDGDPRYKNIFPGNIGKDPRVVDVHVVEASGKVKFLADFDIYLRPLRPIDNITPDIKDTSEAAKREWAAAGLPKTPLPPLDLSGLWYEESGGLVTVETFGNIFIAAEYPHPRKWGTVFGALSGDTIRGVDFRGLSHTESILSSMLQRYMQLGQSGEIRPVLSPLNKQLSWQEDDPTMSRPVSTVLDTEPTVGIPVSEATEISNQLRGAIFNRAGSGGRGVGEDLTNNAIWSTALSTGVVARSDPFNTDVDEARIEWTGGMSLATERRYWSKYTKSKTYRFLKVEITRETGGHDGGRLEINEIEFFEGILAQTEYPRKDMKMQSPRTPSPQLVTCSSFTDQPKHCFRAFDGDSSGTSAWETIPVGSDRKSLTPMQWINFDFGEGLGIRPTSLRIVCGNSNPENALGCPMTFKFLGSSDNVRFTTLLAVDMFDYKDGYNSADGLTFDLFWEAPQGRENGHRCGSCDTGPYFVCSTSSFDSTCASRYCGVGGYCEAIPICPAGWYLASSAPAAVDYEAANIDILSAEGDRMSVACAPCPPGRYGEEPGLVHSNCSGLCEAGYYCTGASTTPRQHMCGSLSVFCPEGTGPNPVPIGAGMKCSSRKGADHTCVATSLCSPGHYCINGLEKKCPAGRHGTIEGLMTPECSGVCLPGEYCPEGSVIPTICPKGYFCSHGHVKSPCPAGRFGARTGIDNQACSGLCQAGYYCPEGSVSRTELKCPAGRYGAIAGLPDASCSGPCYRGYYCPEASTNEKAIPCGGSGVFCPEGSSEPIAVLPGYYSVGSSLSSDVMTRTNQSQCEAGFYCVVSEYPQLDDPNRGKITTGRGGGIKFPCPSGSFGSVRGLVSKVAPKPGNEYNPAKFSDFVCSGLCERGFYCSFNSTSPRQEPCPAGRYGATDGLTDDGCTALCPMGHYCPLGSFEPVPCPAGTYGNASGLTSDTCSSKCWSSNADRTNKRSTVIALAESSAESAAAASTAGAFVYAPGVVCSEASPNYCHEGFYCPVGSISGEQMECGHSGVYCPRGSRIPVSVRTGYYSVPIHEGTGVSEHGGRRQIAERICPVGHYCVDGVRVQCPPGTFGETEGLHTQLCSGLCPKGHYCPEKSVNGTHYRCPAGRYGAMEGLGNSACSGLCSPGYYCPESSTSPTQRQCGLGIATVSNSSLSIQNSVFCPEGSPAPLAVQAGYYSIGFNRSTRHDTIPCPMGSYCVDGVINDCPAGRYGALERLTDPDCSGPCRKGHYCPPGSTSRAEFPCPIGRYGSSEGLTNPFCSGECPYPEICPAGSEVNYLPSSSLRSDIL